MKTFILASFIFLFCTVASLSSFADDASNPPADATAVLGTQMDVTKATVNHLMQQLYARKPSDQFHIADYKGMEPGIQAKIEQGLTHFESELKNSVLKQLKPLMDRYNAVYSSPEFSADQKQVILAQQLPDIQSGVYNIESEYQKDIMSVYGLAGDLPYDIQLMRYYVGSYCRNNNLPDSIRDSIREKFKIPQAPSDSCVEYDFAAPILLESGLSKNNLDLVVNGYDWSSYSSDTSNPDRSYITEVLGPLRNALNGGDGWSPIPRPGFGPDTITLLNLSLVTNDFNSNIPQTISVYLSSSDAWGEWLYDQYATEMYPIISQGCRSKLCVDLRTSDIGYFLNLVNSEIDRPINVKLEDGTQLVVDSPHLNIAITKILLTTIDNYRIQLPFDTE